MEKPSKENGLARSGSAASAAKSRNRQADLNVAR
jgi:hypothetical protein